MRYLWCVCARVCMLAYSHFNVCLRSVRALVQDTNAHMQAFKSALKHALTCTHIQKVMVPETRHVQVPKQIMVAVQETIMVPQVRICVRLCVPTFSMSNLQHCMLAQPLRVACIHVHRRQGDQFFFVDHLLMHQACVFKFW